MEVLRQRNIKLDSDLEDLREENDRIKRENDLLSAGLSWGERAEYSAKAEAAQFIPPASNVAPQGAPDRLPRQHDSVEPVAGPSRTPITMSDMTQAMIPLLKDNISQIVNDALKTHTAQAATIKAADRAHIAKLELRLTQLSQQPLASTSSQGSIQQPYDERLVAKAMQSSPSELEHLLPLPVGFSPLRQSETQTSTSVAESEESDGTGGFETGSLGKPATVTKITHHDTNNVVAVFASGTVKAKTIVGTPTTSEAQSPDHSAMETDTDTDTHTVSDI